MNSVDRHLDYMNYYQSVVSGGGTPMIYSDFVRNSFVSSNDSKYTLIAIALIAFFFLS